MMRFSAPRPAAVLLACVTLTAGATHAQQGPPIRQLGATTATASDTFGLVSSVRQLPGGQVLVNDVSRRKLVLLDSALQLQAVVADSAGTSGNAYSGHIAGLIPFRGDSTLFVEPQSLSMQVIDPTGRIGRVMSVPSSNDALALAGMQGTPGFDASGRLVYRTSPRFQMRGGPGAAPPQLPDSAAIVRVDLATRAVDTVGFIRTPRVNMQMERSEDGRVTRRSQLNPLPVVDDWAVLADGSVAFIRGRDYRVEVFGADGTRRVSQKVPFEWQRLTEEDKVAFIDSVRAQRERMAAAADSARGEPAAVGAAGGGAAPNMSVTTVTSGPPGAGERRTVTAAAGGPPGRGRMNVTFVDPGELPDYKPAFFANSVRADADGNMWVRTIPTRATPGGPVYDVINGSGELVDRVQVPAGRTIAGFGAGGVVYLVSRGAQGAVLERARVR